MIDPLIPTNLPLVAGADVVGRGGPIHEIKMLMAEDLLVHAAGSGFVFLYRHQGLLLCLWASDADTVDYSRTWRWVHSGSMVSWADLG
jgi:hypothetical protein